VDILKTNLKILRNIEKAQFNSERTAQVDEMTEQG
jgi:hypothetical protein